MQQWEQSTPMRVLGQFFSFSKHPIRKQGVRMQMEELCRTLAYWAYSGFPNADASQKRLQLMQIMLVRWLVPAHLKHSRANNDLTLARVTQWVLGLYRFAFLTSSRPQLVISGASLERN